MTALYGNESNELNAQIRELSLEGLSMRAIGEALGHHERMIAGRVGRMRKAGYLPSAIQCRSERTKRSKIACHSAKYDRRLGTMSTAMDCMSAEQIHWLYSNTPKGMSVAQHVASILKDVYFEEVEDDRQG